MGPGRACRSPRHDRRLPARRLAGAVHAASAIASLYAEAPSYDQTDWPQILTLYDKRLKVWPSPVVALNRAVPLAMIYGPVTALAEIEKLERDGRLSGYQYLPAIKADLLSRLGRTARQPPPPGRRSP